jgi:type IV secretory pathway VirB10-like protein
MLTTISKNVRLNPTVSHTHLHRSSYFASPYPYLHRNSYAYTAFNFTTTFKKNITGDLIFRGVTTKAGPAKSIKKVISKKKLKAKITPTPKKLKKNNRLNPPQKEEKSKRENARLKQSEESKKKQEEERKEKANKASKNENQKQNSPLLVLVFLLPAFSFDTDTALTFLIGCQRAFSGILVRINGDKDSTEQKKRKQQARKRGVKEKIWRKAPRCF